ncbi:Formyltransferase [Hymenopellis radicata]|nr:Formyltransferase [Hymenopellis radicata]
MLRCLHLRQSRPAWSSVRYYSVSQTVPEKFKILFLGRDEFSCTVFKELHGAEDLWESIDIITNRDERVGRRGSIVSISPLKTLGLSLDTPIHIIPRERKDMKSWLPPAPFAVGAAVSNHLLVTASFGRILPFCFLKPFDPLRRINVHPSLLPKYRGAAPIQHAILNGESETGVSIITMLKRSEGIDAGRVFASTRVAMAPNATYLDLREALALQGGKLLVQTLRDMQAGKVNSVEQSGNSTSAPVITFEDSLLDFKTMTAESILRRLWAIAHQRPLTARTRDNSTIQLHDISIPDTPLLLELTRPGMAYWHRPTNQIFIRCAEDTIIAVGYLKADGRALIAAGEWWNGVRGVRLVEDQRYEFA